MSTPNDLPIARLYDEAWVAAAPPAELRRSLSILLERPDENVLPILAQPACAGRVSDIVKSLKHGVEAELAQANAERLTEQQRYLAMGQSGKRPWFNYLSLWQQRKAELGRRRAFAERLLVQCRMGEREARIVDADRNQAHTRCIRTLCMAIANHETATAEPSHADKRLWAVLERIEVPHDVDSYISGRQLVDRIGRAS